MISLVCVPFWINNYIIVLRTVMNIHGLYYKKISHFWIFQEFWSPHLSQFWAKVKHTMKWIISVTQENHLQWCQYEYVLQTSSLWNGHAMHVATLLRKDIKQIPNWNINWKSILNSSVTKEAYCERSSE